MTTKTLTPAQDYALRMINALDGLIENPYDVDWSNDILITVLERPRTLRNALAAYLYKSRIAQLNRENARNRRI